MIQVLLSFDQVCDKLFTTSENQQPCRPGNCWRMGCRGKDHGSVYEDFTKIAETTWPSPKTSNGGCALDLSEH